MPLVLFLTARKAENAEPRKLGTESHFHASNNEGAPPPLLTEKEPMSSDSLSGKRQKGLFFLTEIRLCSLGVLLS